MSQILGRFLPLVLLLSFHSGTASAQSVRTPNLRLGDAVVTGFSGTIAPDPSKPRPAGKSAIDLTFINPDGPSARIVDVSKPGYVWDGRLLAAPKTFDVLAKDVGQVFGVALDDAAQPNIYVAATSVFGLNIVNRGRDGQPERRKKGGPGAGWMKGQFGLDLQGGPGGIYKIDGRTGVVTLFANVALDGVPNPGPGIGNLAYDSATKQLFVSDLYTGMIHRFDLDGKELGVYDHGVTGLAAAKLVSVPFNPGNRPNIASDRFDSEKPDTWGFAPAPRRVWGLAVHQSRLYYSVVSGPQIWSVGIARDGSFAADPRWELDVPAQAGPLPVSDIAFSQKGAMILAQRALISGAYDYSAFTRPGEPQVFRIWLKGPQDPPSPGRWKLTPEEYAVGFAGNYRNTNGGVALGYGYGQDGALSANGCEFSLWTTGQNLRNAPSLKTRLDPGGPLVVHGLAGVPASPVRDVNTPPWLSYSVGYADSAGDPRAAGHLGSVRILSKPCASPLAYSGPGYPASPPYIVTTTIVTPANCIFGGNCPPPGTSIDLGIGKIGENNPNNPYGPFNFTLGVRNLGAPITTPQTITVSDVVPAGMTFTNVTSANWNCLPVIGPPMPAGATLTCSYTGTFPIAANQALGWVTIVATGASGGPYKNCAKLDQPDSDPSNNEACVTVETKKVGELIVKKEVVPHVHGTQLPPQNFTVNVTCGGTVTTLTLTDGGSQTVSNIPYSTSCTVVEVPPTVPPNMCPSGTSGAWTISYAPPQPVPPIMINAVTTTVMITNTFDCVPSGGSLTDLGIAKIGEVNLANPNGPYNFTIGVRNLGAVLTGPTTLTFTDVVPAGLTFTNVTSANWACIPLPGPPIPAGATLTCTYTGTFPIAANQSLGWVTIVANGGNGPYKNCANLGQPDGDPSNDEACATVEKSSGNFTVMKEVVNNTTPQVSTAGLLFPVAVTCGSSVTNLNLVNGLPQTVGPIPFNTTCTVLEGTPPLPTGACPPGQQLVWTTPPLYFPSNSVNIVSGVNSSIIVRNTLACTSGGGSGSLIVNKEVINNTSIPVPASSVYAISASCVSGMSPGVVTAMPLTNGGSQTVSPLALNTVCTITETPPTPPSTGPVSCGAPGSTLAWTTVLPAPVTVTGSGMTATVQNILNCIPPGGQLGTLIVTKTVLNKTQGQVSTAGLHYPFSVSCASGGSPAAVSTFNITENSSYTVSNVALNSSCTVTEGTMPTATGTCATTGAVPTWALPPTITPASPVPVNGTTVTVTVLNTMECKIPGQHGYYRVTKTIDNQTSNTNAYLNGLVFPTTSTCDGNTVALNVQRMVPGIVTNIPAGAVCSVVETLPPAPSTGCPAGKVATWGTPTYTPATVTIVSGAGPVIAMKNVLTCEVAKNLPPPACKPPLVAGARPGDCVCPAGLTKKGAGCAEPLSCRSPQKLNQAGTACVCPEGMTKKGNACVEKERERPRVTPNDVIRVLPGLIGPGGFGGGRGEPRGGGGGGGSPGRP